MKLFKRRKKKPIEPSRKLIDMTEKEWDEFIDNLELKNEAENE